MFVKSCKTITFHVVEISLRFEFATIGHLFIIGQSGTEVFMKFFFVHISMNQPVGNFLQFSKNLGTKPVRYKKMPYT